MKAYKKSKLEYKNGYIMKDDKVITVNRAVVSQLNELDRKVQEARHRKVQESNAKTVSMIMDDKFEPATEHAKIGYDVSTPELDAAIDKAIDIMDEIDASNRAEMAERYLRGIEETIEFVDSNRVLDKSKVMDAKRFDLPVVGNPLELDLERLLDLVAELYA